MVNGSCEFGLILLCHTVLHPVPLRQRTNMLPRYLKVMADKLILIVNGDEVLKCQKYQTCRASKILSFDTPTAADK